MNHVPQADIIRLAAGELDEPRKSEVERHMQQCTACREACEQQTATWQMLGEWSPQAAETDIFTSIDERLRGKVPSHQSLWANLGRASRVAAAIAIGIGAGYTAARTSAPSQPEATQRVSVETAQEDALTALRVEHFEDYAPAGLFVAWQDITQTEQEEGMP